MLKKDGLYLLPIDNKNFKLYYCKHEQFQKLYENDFAGEVVDMMSIDSDAVQIAMGYIIKENVVNQRFSQTRAENFFTQNKQVAKIIEAIDTTLGLLIETELDLIKKPSPDDRRGYEDAIASQIEIYDRFACFFGNIKFLIYYYADLECDLSEKPKRIFEIDKSFYDAPFQEFYYNDFECENNFVLPFSKGYYFDSAANYLTFLFLNTITLNSNICRCFNCKELFVAKTNKRTFYCDRMQTEDGKTCKQIGPPIRTQMQSELFGFKDYDMAVMRNYKRMERHSLGLSGTRAEKTLSWIEYEDWLQRAKAAKEKWIKEEISDDEFLEIVDQLD